MKYLIACSAAALIFSGSASAKDNQTTMTVKEDKMAGKPDMADPTRVICEKQETTGSRLGVRRVCATAAEWDAIRQQERQITERVQKGRTTQ